LWVRCRNSTIGGVVKRAVGRLTMLQWKPRLVVLAAILALVLLAALGGLGFGDIQIDYNLYW